MRVQINVNPFDKSNRPQSTDDKPAHWIADGKEPDRASRVLAFRRRFSIESANTVRIHVSADERYELFIDGQRLGRGPDRGDLANWYFETYDLDLTPGQHTLSARVNWFGNQAPYAQFSCRSGFLLQAEDELNETLSTGLSQWQVRVLDGYTWTKKQTIHTFMSVGAGATLDGRVYPWDYETSDSGWSDTVSIQPATVYWSYGEKHWPWVLRPAMLPAQINQPVPTGIVRHVDAAGDASVPVRQLNHLPAEAKVWQNWLAGQSPVVVPVHTQRRIIVDLDNYYCAYSSLVVSGGSGARVSVQWAESLYHDPKTQAKGNRNEIEGKMFHGIGNQFITDGGLARRFDGLWWDAGRYLEIRVRTEAQPLSLDRLLLGETRYPYENESSFEASDDRLSAMIPTALRTLQMCSHETYMDCPYYEQLMYVGDTRLEVLTTYATTHDDRLPRKAIKLFEQSRDVTGLTTARYPSRVRQVIPPFSLWWIGMVHDFMMWRDDPSFVRDSIMGVRTVLDAYLAHVGSDGLVRSPAGWNYIDWCPDWPNGMPRIANPDLVGTINLHLLYTLKLAAEVEDYAGDAELAERNRRRATELAGAVNQAFWDESRGLYADDTEKTLFSEHAQSMALLSRCADVATRRSRVVEGLIGTDLVRTTIYFSHYLFEAWRATGRIEQMWNRLPLWFDLCKNGFRTTVEMPEPSRSDCHAWGAHPVFHYLASILGIRPGEAGFRSVRIEPQLGPLQWARGTMPHPRGEIRVDVSRKGEALRGQIELPEGVNGLLVVRGASSRLTPGLNLLG